MQPCDQTYSSGANRHLTIPKMTRDGGDSDTLVEEHGLLSECSVEEGGHLTPGDDARRAVPIIDRRVAAFGDRSGAELVGHHVLGVVWN